MTEGDSDNFVRDTGGILRVQNEKFRSANFIKKKKKDEMRKQ